jgi:16S rRNA (guanine527-N7)-methyltransferase
VSALAEAPKQRELDRQLDTGLARLGLDLGHEARSRLIAHLELVGKWNRVHNLTSVRDLVKSISVHSLDSLSAVPYLPHGRILDAGSGAGFPGIPLALARPGSQVDLLDSNHKKCAFLRQAVAELDLKNARVVCERIELWHPAWQYDCIISRALAEIVEIIALSSHLLAPGGVIAAMKGVPPLEEIERIPSGFRVRQVHALAVPGLDAQRHLVLIERA